MDKKYATVLRTYCAARKINATQLSRASGIPRRRIYGLWSGAHIPKRVEMITLATLLGVSPSVIFPENFEVSKRG